MQRVWNIVRFIVSNPFSTKTREKYWLDRGPVFVFVVVFIFLVVFFLGVIFINFDVIFNFEIIYNIKVIFIFEVILILRLSSLLRSSSFWGCLHKPECGNDQPIESGVGLADMFFFIGIQDYISLHSTYNIIDI